MLHRFGGNGNSRLFRLLFRCLGRSSKSILSNRSALGNRSIHSRTLNRSLRLLSLRRLHRLQNLRCSLHRLLHLVGGRRRRRSVRLLRLALNLRHHRRHT